MRKLFIIFLNVLIVISIYGSITKWNTLKQDPFQIYSLTSLYNYSSAMMDDDGLNEEIIFDYISNNIYFYGSLQGTYGKIGVYFINVEDTMYENLLMNTLGKIYPFYQYGIILGKKSKNINIAIDLGGFSIDNSYTDLNSSYSDITSKVSLIKIHPSVSIFFSNNVEMDIAPEFNIQDVVYEDYRIINEKYGKLSYNISGRIINFVNDNKFVLYTYYSKKSYSYDEIVKSPEMTDRYENYDDSLKIGFIAQIESFNYIKSYFDLHYIKTDYSNIITYSNSASDETKKTITKFPSFSSGFNIYVFKNVYFNTGIETCIEKTDTKSGLELNEETINSSFNFDYMFGVSLDYNDFQMNIGFTKNIIQLPYIISGNQMNNVDISFGLSYKGFEF